MAEEDVQEEVERSRKDELVAQTEADEKSRRGWNSDATAASQ